MDKQGTARRTVTASRPPPWPGKADAPAVKLVAYFRVSTEKQGESGLGLQAQEDAVRDYARRHSGIIIAEYQEIESGRRDDRPQLARAVGHAARSNARLVIAKLDRLARDVHFLSGLIKAGVRLAACDVPSDDEFIFHILSSVAQKEARLIGERTRAGLRAYREHAMIPKAVRKKYPDGLPPAVAAHYAPRAGKLGAQLPECRNLTTAGRRQGAVRSAESRSARARSAYDDLGPWMVELRRSGLSWAAVARRLNAEGHTTPRGRPYGDVQVRRIALRFAPELRAEDREGGTGKGTADG